MSVAAGGLNRAEVACSGSEGALRRGPLPTGLCSVLAKLGPAVKTLRHITASDKATIDDTGAHVTDSSLGERGIQLDTAPTSPISSVRRQDRL